MDIVYALEEFPTKVNRTLFLAGPTPRENGAGSWRKEAIELLEKAGYDGHVFVPEPKGGSWAESYIEQIEWEQEGLERADVILFWVPRDITGKKTGHSMPGFTTNTEFGVWQASGKVVWGAPEWADKVRYQEHYAREFGAPTARTLQQTVELALEKLGEGADREGPASRVPLMVWNQPSFRAWYDSQTAQGNTLENLQVPWSFFVGPKRDRLFLYVTHPSVHIEAEKRIKSNECVVVRPDISMVCLYRRGQSHLDTEIVLVSEYRVAVRNEAGKVYELPGGSSNDPKLDARQVAANEVQEETGLELDPDRLKPIHTRQMVATLSSYQGTLYGVELTEQEMQTLRDDHAVHGEPGGEERTTIHVMTVEMLLKQGLVDWSTLGQIFSCLARI